LDVSQESVKGDYTAGSPIVLQVTLSRDVDEQDESDDQTVVAPFHPFKQMANW
jgi:pre-mRNA-splicing helicase BRR2